MNRMKRAQWSDHQTVNFISALGLFFHPVNPVHPVRFSVFQLHGYG
jgi:hypothetical protein